METATPNNSGQEIKAINPASFNEMGLVRKEVEDQLSEPEKKLSNVKSSFPLMGNFVYKINGSFVDKERLEQLREDHPEVLNILLESRKKYLDLLGINSLSEISNQSDNIDLSIMMRENIARAIMPQLGITSKPSLLDGINLDELSDKIKEQLLKNSQQHDLNETLGKLNNMAKEADFLVRSVIKDFFPSSGGDSDLGITSDISNEHDVGRLVLIATDERIPVRNRYEALRKLSLIEILVELREFERDRKKDDSDLNYFFRAMNKIGIYRFNSREQRGEVEMIMGTPDTKYLFTKHELDTGDCSYHEVCSDEKEAHKVKDNNNYHYETHTTPIAVREFKVRDANGNDHIIEGAMDDRVKDRNSMVLKLLRKNSLDRKRVLKDLNGIRFSFKDDKEVNMFIETLKNQFRENGYDFQIEELDDNLGSGRLNCRQIKFKIDERYFEAQIFTHKQYADYLFKHPWGEYEINRFFDSSSSEAFFPSEIYPKLNRKKSRKMAKDRHNLMANTKHYENGIVLTRNFKS